MNVDVAVKVTYQKAGLEVIIRNSSGEIVAAVVQRVSYQVNMVCMKVEIVLFGIKTTQKVECVPMIVESDSTKVVDLSLNRKGSKTKISWTIAEIQASLKGHSSICSRRL